MTEKFYTVHHASFPGQIFVRRPAICFAVANLLVSFDKNFLFGGIMTLNQRSEEHTSELQSR